MKLSFDVRIGRLQRVRASLRAQLPFLEPGVSARRQLCELLGVVDDALTELRRRQARREVLCRRQALRDCTWTMRRRPAVRRRFTPPPALPASAGRVIVDQGVEFEVVWPRTA